MEEEEEITSPQEEPCLASYKKGMEHRTNTELATIAFSLWHDDSIARAIITTVLHREPQRTVTDSLDRAGSVLYDLAAQVGQPILEVKKLQETMRGQTEKMTNQLCHAFLSICYREQLLTLAGRYIPREWLIQEIARNVWSSQQLQDFTAGLPQEKE
jgi:hypothetical protein